MNKTRPLLPWLLWAAIALIWFGALDHRDLFQTDEGRYAEIPREMLVSGDWVTPRLNGFLYFEKPPLQYWATAAAYHLFGQHNWTARLWTALCGFLGLVASYWAAKRFWGPRAALFATAFLLSSPYYLAMGHFNSLDMGLACFLNLALFAFLAAQHQEGAPLSRYFMLLCWLFLALALLNKGLVALVLPGLTLIGYSLWKKDWRLWQRLELGWGLGVLLLVTAPWFLVVSARNPGFLQFFFIHEHFQRYLSEIHERVEPWWYFLPILLLGMLPWIFAAWRVLVFPPQARVEAGGGVQIRAFLWLWVIMTFVFFSLSGSKLPSYILPLFPALALLVGDGLSRDGSRGWWSAAFLSLVTGLALIGLGSGGTFWGKGVTDAMILAFAPWLFAAAFILIAGGGGLWWCARGRNGQVAVPALAAAWLLAGQLLMTGLQALAPAYSSGPLVRQLDPEMREAARTAPFYSVAMYQQSLPFYLDRTLRLVGFRGELDYGIEREPWLWVQDIPSFIRLWEQETGAFAVMTTKVFQQLKQEGVAMRQVADDGRRVIVTSPR